MHLILNSFNWKQFYMFGLMCLSRVRSRRTPPPALDFIYQTLRMKFHTKDYKVAWWMSIFSTITARTWRTISFQLFYYAQLRHILTYFRSFARSLSLRLLTRSHSLQMSCIKSNLINNTVWMFWNWRRNIIFALMQNCIFYKRFVTIANAAAACVLWMQFIFIEHNLPVGK